MEDRVFVAVDEQIAALVPRFLANRAVDVGKIRAALGLADFESIRMVAHAMKGSGGGYGFPEISRLGAAMEARAREHDAAQIAALVTDLEAYLARIVVATGNVQNGTGDG